VRVNAPRSPWCHLDVAALAALPTEPASIVVPKVESAADLAFVDRLLDGVEAGGARRRPLRVQALIETAAGLANVREIALGSRRLDALVIGYADLSASLGGTRGLDTWLPAQHDMLIAARAAGLQAIDGPYFGTAADADFHAAAARARELGFDGKWAIHPSHVEPINRVFSPTDDEVRHARAVIAALDAAARDTGQGALGLDGQMLDQPSRVNALRVLRAASAPVSRPSP
jgi:citrate lyase subunit beta/citryl-CoA lyase